MKYPTIETYINGNLVTEWAKEKESILADDPHQSYVRAGELAAAKILKAYFTEAPILDLAPHDPAMADDEAALYDQWQAALDNETIQSALIRMSQSRTLIADLDRV